MGGLHIYNLLHEERGMGQRNEYGRWIIVLIDYYSWILPCPISTNSITGIKKQFLGLLTTLKTLGEMISSYAHDIFPYCYQLTYLYPIHYEWFLPKIWVFALRLWSDSLRQSFARIVSSLLNPSSRPTDVWQWLKSLYLICEGLVLTMKNEYQGYIYWGLHRKDTVSG